MTATDPRARLQGLPDKPQTTPLKSAHFPDDHRVLTGWPRLHEWSDPVFGDLRWDLTAGIATANLHPCDRILDFSRVGNAVRRITVMEFVAARMCKRHPEMGLMAPSSAVQHLVLLSRFNAFLDTEHGGCSYADVTQDVLDDYLLWCRKGRKGKPVKDTSVTPAMRTASTLWKFREWLTHDTLTFQPWKGRAATRVSGASSHPDENTTERVPEPVTAAALRWALFYLNTAADDILAARDEHQYLRSQSLTATHDVAIERLRSLVARRRAAGRGLPRVPSNSLDKRVSTVDPDVNLALVARLAGYSPSLHGRRNRRRGELFETIQTGVEELGLEFGGYATEISVSPETGEPWRDHFEARRLYTESNRLLTACYIVVAYLSGMRDSEVQALERGCHFTEPTDDGVLVRHKLRGWVVKRRGGRRERAAWVVLPEVARAIQVLERLTAQRLLFTLPGSSIQVAAKGIVKLINDFAAHVNTIADRVGLPPIPPVIRDSIDGQTTTEAWHFTTRQFRRTLAWHIARQPFGLVAGKIQYQQASVSIFEGYAGTSESGFRAEVEKERAEAQIEDIVERYEDDLHGRSFTGGAAARLKADFAKIRAELGDFPGRRADRARVRAMLRGLSRTYRVGVLADCAFDEANPDKAVCVSETNKARKAKRVLPILDACQPANCANACQTEKHIVPWQRMVAEVDEHLKDKKFNDIQRQALLRQRKAWQGILDRLQGAEEQESAS